MNEYNDEQARVDYNEVVYPGGSHGNTHPDNLYLIGRMFGLNPTAMDKMRVLEIGCAIGNNLFPMAVKFPNAQFVGIDLSDRQITEARRVATDGGFDNVQFVCGSIVDYATMLGKFDYIICHGLFSWVPDNVQKAILLCIQTSLTPHGLAVVSYNTRPGWNFLQTIRDVMMYSIKGKAKTKESLGEAKKLFEYINEYSTDKEGILSKELKNRYDTWMRAPDYYLAHELIEGINLPLYFHEFVDLIHGAGLGFVSESNPIAHIMENLHPNLRKIYEEAPSRIHAEQYTDFATNRQFRSSIICRREAKLSKVWGPELFENQYFYLGFDVVKGEGTKWKYRGQELTVGSPENQTPHNILEIMSGHRLPLNVQEWAEFISKKNSTIEPQYVLQFFKTNMMQLFARGFLTITPVPYPIKIETEDKPNINKWARGSIMGSINKNICGILNANQPADDSDRIIIPLMDGKHTIDDITDHLMDLNDKGAIQVTSKNSTMEMRESFKALITQKYYNYLRIGVMS